jgi:hypothetical protein
MGVKGHLWLVADSPDTHCSESRRRQSQTPQQRREFACSRRLLISQGGRVVHRTGIECSVWFCHTVQRRNGAYPAPRKSIDITRGEDARGRGPGKRPESQPGKAAYIAHEKERKDWDKPCLILPCPEIARAGRDASSPTGRRALFSDSPIRI